MKPVAVITGAGSGIGRAVALELALAGFNLVLAGRRLDRLEETLALTVADGLCAVTDVSDPAQVEALFNAATERFGRVDLLFNNAGINAPAVPLDELDAAQIKAVIDTNVLGPLLCARAIMKVMKAQSPQGGRIINNGSISAYAPRPNAAPYATSKHAMTGLTKSLILDGRAFGITASQIDIGNVVSDMSTQMETGILQANGDIRAEPRFDMTHVARTVRHMAELPPEANMPFVTIMATAMPLYGRG
jgi:NAD(P)-dependent dehydrogenase (short-subunit alcohol dehydrogenase family)